MRQIKLHIVLQEKSGANFGAIGVTLECIVESLRPYILNPMLYVYDIRDVYALISVHSRELY